MNVKKKSQIQEKSVAKDLNAKTVIASGALWGSKGDVRSDKLLVECKTTDKSWYSLSLPIWKKIEQEAIHDGLRIPVMCIELTVDGEKVKYAVIKDLDLKGMNILTYHDITKYYVSRFCAGKSFRVSKRELVIFPAGTLSSNTSVTFAIVPWGDFLYHLKGANL